MKINKSKWGAMALLSGIAITAPMLGIVADDQPVSQTSPSGDRFGLYNDSDDDITFSTSTLPTPNCPDDVAAAPAQYFWDFGPLDGTDNGDGTAVVHTDVSGVYQVNVYCQQPFIQVSDSSSYFEETQNSNTNQ